MNKTELEEAIKNGESVWLVFEDRIYKLDRSKIIDINDCCVEYYNNYHRCNLYATTSDFYETEARAKHFISHCGVTRTETLPFLTWEEFKNKERIIFTTPTRFICALSYLDNILTLSVGKNNECTRRFVWDLTEANFYKAYDECVKLFKGEEI